MPSIRELKNLYIAKTKDDLIRRAEEGIISVTSATNLQNLIRSMTRLDEAAKSSRLDGDEERSYILYYRYFQTHQSMKKSNNFKNDSKYISELFGMNRLKEVLDILEELDTSLCKRYSDLKESQELRDKEIAESNEKSSAGSNTDINSTNGLTIDSNESKEQFCSSIDCQTLVDILENSKEMTKILIFDIRTTEDFKESHIDKLKTTADLTVANISQDLLTPGITSSKLENTLPYGNTKDAYHRRRQMNKVVIVDTHSQQLFPNTPAFHLAQALWRWDTTALRIKSIPLLLRGGYNEWALTYPMFTSNPNYVNNSKKITFNRKSDLSFNYELSELEDKPKQSENNMINGITNGDISDESQPKGSDPQEKTYLNNMFHSKPIDTAIPGTAIPIIPDRSTKPKIQNESKTIDNKTEVKEDFEKIKLKKQNQISEEMMSIMREEYNQKIQTIKEDLVIKDKENSNLKTTIRNLLPEKPNNLSSNQIINNNTNENPMITINGDINSLEKRNGYLGADEKGNENKENIKNENQFIIRNSVSINGDINNGPKDKTVSTPKTINKTANSLSVGSNLSRSLSSPNIAQLVAKLDEQFTEDFDVEPLGSKGRSFTNPTQPQFDRTLKPVSNREKFTFHDSANIDNKLRDFCPVHSAGPSITGLRNLGNTCFMSAIIQCLLNITEFSSFFSGKFHINKNSRFGTNGELVLELAALFKTMVYPSHYKSISPKDFKQAIGKHLQGFIGCAQQDSHEFLVKLLEKLHEDLNESSARDVIDTSVSEDLSLNAAANKFWKEHLNKNKSIITQLFEGLIVQTLTCLTCHKTSNTFEVFSCLSLPLSTSHRTSVSECLKQYFKPERMSGEAAWECPTCKQKREADKKVNVWKLPKVLIIHLKRFSYEGQWSWRQKLQTFVDFPIDDLSMDSLNQNDTKYSLYGVINHYGTLEGGHYTAFSQKPNHYKWHRFDDQEISQINSADVKTLAAYILFYKC